MSIKSLLFASSASVPSSTLDQVDIFEDGSGVELYRFNGNANGESGNYHGTEANVMYGGGVYGRAAIFNGSSSYIQTGFNPALISTAFAVSVWIKSSSNGFGIFSNAVSGVNEGHTLDNALGFARFKSVGRIPEFSSTVSITTGSWVHICITWDGTLTSGAVKMYINGVLDNTTTATAINNGYSASTYFGKYGTNANYFNGSIWQGRFFNRGVTAAEVARLANELPPASIIDNIDPLEDGSLKLLYQFNGDATDKTGINNGTATNVTFGTGKFGQCAVFNGGSSKVVTNYTIPSSFTLSFWIKASALPVRNNAIFGLNGTSSTIITASGNNTLGFSIHSPSVVEIGSSGAMISVNGWTHIALTCRSATASLTNQKWYVNGVLQTCTHSGSGAFTFGTFQINPSLLLNGSLEEVCIFNKVLTPMEVAALSSGVTPLEEPMCSQVDPFKDGSGKVLIRFEGNLLDESGNHDGVGTALAYASSALGGRCGVYNGSSTYVTLPNSFNSVNDYSLGIWVKSASASRQFIFSKDNLAPKLALELNRDATNKVSVWFSNGSSTVFLHSTTSITDGEWHLIGISKISAEAKLNIDGIEIATVVPLAISEALQIILGKYDTGNFYFNGNQKQFRVFNRALSTSEWQTLHAKGA